MNRVSGTAVGAPKGRVPGEESRHRGAMGARHVAGDVESIADRFDRRSSGSLSIMNARPMTRDACGAGVGDMEAAIWQRPVVAGSDDEIAAALRRDPGLEDRRR